MAVWSTIIILILLGLVFLVVEVIFIPGTTLVGVAGFVCMIVGIVLSFRYFGQEAGWLTMGAATTASGGLLYIAFRTNVWRRFALNSTIDSKVNEVEKQNFVVGLEGLALSALRPSGKGEFGGNVAEVRTIGDYVAAGESIRIVKVSSNQIIVEKIN